MRPTYRNIVGLMKTFPDWQQAQRSFGMTVEQAAAVLLDDMKSAPNARTRDQIFSGYMGQLGIYTSGVEAFDNGTDEMLTNMQTRDSTERHARTLSAQSLATPSHWPAAQVRALRDVAMQSSLAQGVADRFRDRDGHKELNAPKASPIDPEMARARDDAADRRAALAAAVAGTSGQDYSLHVHDDERRTLRETLSDVWDADTVRREEADPMQDPSLLNMSDFV